MKEVFIIIKQIGDLKEILPRGYSSWEKAKEVAANKQWEIHKKGYTDFKVYSCPITIEE